MSEQVGAPLSRVCAVLAAPRSTVYARRDALRRVAAGQQQPRPGPAGAVGDEELVELIRGVLTECPFAGEGYRKVRARLRRQHGVRVSGKRVLRLLRREGLLAPQRTARRRAQRPHDGRIVTDAPDVCWGTDATMAWTVDDGWVWVFVLVDHHTAEAWVHVSKVGDRFAALQPIYDAVVDRHETLQADVARGLMATPVVTKPVPLPPLRRITGLAWDHRLAGLSRRARMQRVRRTVHQDSEAAVPMGPHLPHHRRPPPSRRRLRRAV